MSILKKIKELKELFDSDYKLLIENQLDVTFIFNKYLGRKGLLNTLYPLLSKANKEEKSDFGKKINDLLHKSDVIFYDEKKGFEILNKTIFNQTNHNAKKINSLIKFQEAIANPISKNTFLKNLNNFLMKSNQF